MKFAEFEGDFFTRHSEKPTEKTPESLEFPGISVEGVELAEARAKDILLDVQKAESGTVTLLVPASAKPRTGSTSRVYGKELKALIARENITDILFLDAEDIKDITGFNNKIEFLAKQIQDNKDKKIILNIPLAFKEFAFTNGLFNKNEELTEFSKELLGRNNGNRIESFKDWIGNKGRIGDLVGPDPQKVAEGHLKDVKRLKEFAKKYLGDRPLNVGSVGHGWNLDTVALYLANNGVVDLEAFKKVEPQLMGETKMIRITQDEEGKELLEYGDLKIPLE